MNVRPTILQLEDEKAWGLPFQDFVVEFSEIQFRDFISVASVEDIKERLASVTGPVIFIIDLKTGSSTNNRYTGYHWILEESELYIREEARTAVFVISGQLHQGIRESLMRRGIPENHIYEKLNWESHQTAFLDALREAVSKFEVVVRNQVFLSYSHKDVAWLERLQVHLKPLERLGTVSRWDDTMIQPGAKWREEIRRALESAKAAVLLVSADFLASDFIANHELPPLLAAAATEGAVVLPVIVSPCWFQQTEIAQFQTVNPPSRPLVGMRRAAQEAVFVKVTEAIEKVLRRPTAP